MRLTDTQLLILNAAGDFKTGVALSHIASKISAANPKRACESLVKRGLLTAAEVKLTTGIGKAAGYMLTKAGEEALGIDNGPPRVEYADDAKTGPRAEKKAAKSEPKAAKDAPKEGTRARGIFDMLTRKGGATSAECRAAGLGDVSLKIHAGRFADRFGLTISAEKSERGERVSLT